MGLWRDGVEARHNDHGWCGTSTSTATTTLTYDNNGNLTSDGTFTNTWDYRNQLASSGNGTATSTYSYDHTGERVALTESGITTVFPNKFYNVSLGTSGTTTKQIFANGALVATVESTATTTAGGSGTIAFDATSTPSITTGFNAGPVTKTWTHTVTGTNPIIVLSADIFQDIGGTGSITSATWNGGAFTLASTTRTGTKSAEMWYLVATTTGAKTVSVTVTGATDAIKMDTASFTNVDQSSPLDAVAVAGGSSGNPSASVTTLTANDVVVATLDRHSTTDATTSQTSLYKDAVTSTLGAASYQLATTTKSYTDTYTGSASQNWAMVIAAFKPASTSGSGTASTTIRYVHTDQLTGSNVVTDASGAIAETLDYYPYGAARLDTKAGGYGGEKRKFAGHEYDAGTGLNYMDARYQSGMRGNFISEDPSFLTIDAKSEALKDPQQLNSYSYVRNNPLRYVDPTGKDYMDYSVSGAVRIYGVPVGPTAGYIRNYSGDDLVFLGINVSAKPGASWSATYYSGEASPGLSLSGSYFLPLDAGVGPGGQINYGQGQNGKFGWSGEKGIGTPGAPSLALSVTFSPTRALNFLGGNFQYISTPATVGINPGNIGKL